uniref:Uncharacterized protein n=1 Tax=Haptolina brevifila TaxID=156173 RepID=A0A7S2NMT6_9EUKA
MVPAHVGSRRSAPLGTHASGISFDHPLSFPGEAPMHNTTATTRTAAPPMPAGFAGKPSGVKPNRQNRTEPRHQYEPPTYSIRRTADSGAKDLLYGGAPPAPTNASRPDHPLYPAYEWLAGLVPQMPRDTDGNADERHVRSALAEAGIDALSDDGLAELLARCDVAPDGFPPFSDFLICLSRPHRALPPSAQQKVVMGGTSALPESYHVAAAESSAAPAAAPPNAYDSAAAQQQQQQQGSGVEWRSSLPQ